MIKLEYRVKTVNGNLYFPQMRIKKCMFWSKWKKVAKHNTGYGLYDASNENYPSESVVDAMNILYDFDRWYKKEIFKNVEYRTVNIN